MTDLGEVPVEVDARDSSLGVGMTLRFLIPLRLIRNDTQTWFWGRKGAALPPPSFPSLKMQIVIPKRSEESFENCL